MTTIPSTSTTPIATSTPTTNSSIATSSTAVKAPYDGAAAVAQAQTLAAQRLANGSSGSQGNLLGLSPDILSLLQGGSGSSEIATLFGSSAGNAFFGAQSHLALYGTGQKLGSAAAAIDRVSDLIASNNSYLNVATAEALKPVTIPSATASTTSSPTASTDTTM